MAYYGGTITVAGRNLITSLIAGETIQFTRVTVGSGKLPEGKSPLDMTELVKEVAQATSTDPVSSGGEVCMTVEYRNDMNGGLKEGFWLSEFGVFAKTAETEEILLYYATLGDSPQPVSAFRNDRVDIRRYPITIALEVDAKVQVLYDTNAFLTSKNAKELLDSMLSEALTSGHVLPVNVLVKIPNSNWKDGNFDGLPLKYRDVTVKGVTPDTVPFMTMLPQYMEKAAQAGMYQTCMTFRDNVRVYSKEPPAEELTASLTLFLTDIQASAGGDWSTLPIASTSRLGVVKVGNNILVEPDGTIHIDSADVVDDHTATYQEADDVIDGIYGEDDV